MTSSNPPPCWHDGSCSTPVSCYLRGCWVTGYRSPKRYEPKTEQALALFRQAAGELIEIERGTFEPPQRHSEPEDPSRD